MDHYVAEIRVDDLQARGCARHRIFGLQDGIDDAEVGNTEYTQWIRGTMREREN